MTEYQKCIYRNLKAFIKWKKEAEKRGNILKIVPIRGGMNMWIEVNEKTKADFE